MGSLIALTVEEGEDWADVAIPAAAAGAPAAAKAEKKPPPAKAEVGKIMIFDHFICDL